MYTVCPVDFKTGDRCNHTGSAASETQEGERAELFAKEIGKRTGIPVETKLLYRCINTRPQKELNDQERKKNLKKAFTIAQNIVQLRKVLLVDDIYTTGSTVDAAAECLKVSGIQEVYVLCISIGRGH